MGLFDQVASAIQDPNRQASNGQISQIMSAAQQIGQQNNADPSTMQQAMSVVGSFVRSSLREKRQAEGDAAAQAIVNRSSDNGTAAIQQLFSAGRQQQMTEAVSQRTGLSMSQVQSMLPVLVPLVMKLLSSGSNRTGVTAGNSNNILSTFLDADNDGDVDMGDMLSMAGRFR
ncbi:DUF937 domain-containing protein [Romeria aff. gracilis LEGE 07310]|uniref:DUF937 domain-containing protein n=1 Tax=Vasconcelosia minhoensis LEGE 07310 TaxID=915328 RepID=A0A8J7AQP6_9CYAN|nr:DUF937 domain-containing protein [Romeria gracilis]MBE9078879.1 DUF937 domain-containing protein [Romeria aff. gracilis LEGE 07310]